jgi:hypothetical protein
MDPDGTLLSLIRVVHVHSAIMRKCPLRHTSRSQESINTVEQGGSLPWAGKLIEASTAKKNMNIEEVRPEGETLDLISLST